MKVAIVDDDPIVCSSLSTILTASGTARILWTANNGEDAVRRYQSEADLPDVLLIDVQMPGMDGLSAAERILNSHPAARLLFLTTFADKTYIARALAVGAKGYLVKQDVSSVAPALQAVMAGQIVLGSEALAGLSVPVQANSAEPTSSLPSATTSARFASLTMRDRQIAALVADGLDNHAIAARLSLSEGSVRNRVSSILAKTHLSNRTQLAIEWLSDRNAGTSVQD